MWVYLAIMAGAALFYYLLGWIGSFFYKKLQQVNGRCETEKNNQEQTKKEIDRLKRLQQSLTRFTNRINVEDVIGISSGVVTVAEKTREFANEITGHRVDVWIYTTPTPFGEEPVRIHVAGHANELVCREVSAALSTAYHRKEKIGEDDYFVTGAGVLVNDGMLNKISDRDFLSKIAQDKLHGDIGSLGELVKQLQTFEAITGLIKVHASPLHHYLHACKTINEQILSIFHSGVSDVFFRFDPGDDGMLLDMPFYRYEKGKLAALRITIQEQDLQSKEFNILKERHQKALIQEMLEDVKNRNRTYKQWLQEDLEKRQIFSRLDSEELITISGTRDYSQGKVVASQGEKIPLKQYLQEHLPGLIEEDNRWIKRTDTELARLEKFRQDAGKTDNLNYTLLIDSFLRGWPSIFFESVIERNLYDDWLKEKREKVWLKISENLMEQNLDPVYLFHTNIIFKVVARSHGEIVIEPHYHLLTNAYMISVDVTSGFVRYVHPWEHRQCLPLLIDDRPVTEHEVATQSAVLMQEGFRYLEANELQIAKIYFTLALRCDAGHSFDSLTSYWWNHLSKNTSARYQEQIANPYFSRLITGLSLPTNSDIAGIEQRRDDLLFCIHTEPDALADPYLFLSIFCVFDEFVNDKETEKKQYLAAARRKMDQIINDFKGGKLLPEVMQSGPISQEEFNKLVNPVYASNSRDFVEKERAFEKIFVQGMVSQLSRQEYFKLKADEQSRILNKVLSDIFQQEIVKMGMEAYSRGEIAANSLNSIVPSLFDRINRDERCREYLERARRIDAGFIDTVFSQQQLSHSDQFWVKIGACGEILKANAMLELSNWIVNLRILWKDFPKSRNNISAVINDYIEIRYPLNPFESTTIERLGQIAAKIKENVKASEDVLYLLFGELRSLQAELLNHAARIYKNVPLFDLMEPNEARVLIASQNHCAYREAIHIMVSGGRSLRLMTKEIDGVVLDATVNRLEPISNIDITRRHGHTVVTATVNGELKPILELNGLTEEDFQHVFNHFIVPDWKAKVQPIGASVAEMILNSPIPHAPRVQRYADILCDAEVTAILIHIMAYSNRHLAKNRMVKAIWDEEPWPLNTVKKGVVIGDVMIDFEEIYRKTKRSL